MVQLLQHLQRLVNKQQQQMLLNCQTRAQHQLQMKTHVKLLQPHMVDAQQQQHSKHDRRQWEI